ncbi:GNAT family N-acetyltransferase [Lacticaseibacillus jixianensis]|uniref:GNAT family N-acetyltransferase n=1 Tax=Lacticaseibacillus jixianensis TaxID=2486012 RepID=A0ABW4BA69_9LACO|nr:GNAT family N-acetyltransferase [Lacticaseibacillus jixianensis]
MTEIRYMNRPEAKAYLEWTYAAPYEFYNIPAAEHAAEMDEIFAEDGDDYYSALDGDALIGMYEYSFPEGVMEIGLGLAPEYTGAGRGRGFVQDGIAFGRQRYHYAGPITLEVAAFNARARHLYEALGFKEMGTREADAYGTPVTFVKMQLDQ